MAYHHYRNNVPGWGTQNFQLVAPPVPGYQPMPTWTGLDFYSAHAMGGDPMLYQNTMSRFHNWFGGVGKEEARYWHSRAYGGIGEVTRMMPEEIGAAAAYEAYREMKYSSSMYNFLYSDFERHREALRGMAIAEVVRLWQDTGRAFDQYGQQVACDAAASTADQILRQREMEGGHLGMGLGAGSYRDRRNSFSAYPVSGYAGSMGGSVYGGGSPMMGSMGIPGSPYSPMGGGFGQAVGMPMSYGGGYGGSYGGGYPGSYGGGYPGSYGGSPYDLAGGLQVPGIGFPGYATSLPGTPAALILPPAEGHHHRRSRSRSHRHHRRHRSHDRY
ncbi:hypothetical protein BGW80DRAFT_1351803 [Lactifluus volemus]|nr:hypothetical protein BGW80DRAFT_1351803 [Lactifluus volemus]